MKNSIIYAFVFLALQILAGVIVHGIWGLVADTQDATTMELVVTMVVFATLVIAVFLLARWTEVSPRWMLTRPWMVLIWAVIAAWGMMIPETWMMEMMPELPNWIEDEQAMLMSDY